MSGDRGPVGAGLEQHLHRGRASGERLFVEQLPPAVVLGDGQRTVLRQLLLELRRRRSSVIRAPLPSAATEPKRSSGGNRQPPRPREPPSRGAPPDRTDGRRTAGRWPPGAS